VQAKEVLIRLSRTALRRHSEFILHYLGWPNVEGLHRALVPGASEFVEAMVANKADTLSKARAEYEALIPTFKRLVSELTLPFPLSWGTEQDTTFVLYALARLHRPSVILELGVANGVSTYWLLSALKANGRGVLHSVDVDPRAGHLIDSMDEQWCFHLHDARSADKQLESLLNRLPGLAMFFHDASHDYVGQLHDYQAVQPFLAPGAIVISDDVHSSHAFGDWATTLGCEPIFLFDRRKIIGGFTF
jgi:predicted O-methyltransferase YrrM